MHYIYTCVTCGDYCTVPSPTLLCLLSKSWIFTPLKLCKKTLCCATSLLIPQRIWQKKIMFFQVVENVLYSVIFIYLFIIFLSLGCYYSPRHCWDGRPDPPREGEVFPFLHRGEAAFPQPAWPPLKRAVRCDPSVQWRAPKWVLDPFLSNVFTNLCLIRFV